MASVAYGPEAIVLVLAAAGTAGLGFTLPVTLAIVVLLAVLIASYRQVIAAFPNGGGAYAVAKERLGHRTSLVAAASLIVDYVLNVAVSIAAGVAALTSAFPALFPYTVWICLAVLAGITALNLYGIRESARAFMAPTVVFVLGILAVIVVGLLRTEPDAVATGAAVSENARTIGILLLLKAFSSGCAALTGVEAIANAVPSFAQPKVRRAQRAEVALGTLLGVMLIGLALLIEKFSIRPLDGTTVLSQLTEAALGHGIGYYIVQFATVVLLALAANTSYGGLPTLTKILADDNCLPHRFAVTSPRQVYRFGVLALGISAAVLLIASEGNMNALVPLFAIGVFVGFTIAQVGMVRHWLANRVPGWRWRIALNGFGAVLTFVALVVTTSMKFAEGAWLIVLVLPLLVVAMERIRRTYGRIDGCRGAGCVPAEPRATETAIVVPVSEVSELSREALSAAMSLGRDVTAVHVCLPGENITVFTKEWEAWHPDVRLLLLEDGDSTVGGPVARYVRDNFAGRRKVVVIAEIEPPAGWNHVLPSHRSDALERVLRKMPDTVVCHLRVQTA
ncbi:APC family permease [Nocardia seriolae]|uniref:APC family permease n=1 Tax=Nocardia seriolae TaxID=37332 RepID=UPI0009E06C73|nr:APC family permease [Nocardia seriolae]MTJ64302.1 amino acid permease [Nocardia seriolae]MTJ74961.1 amino acid permease [Nocardia seriolae]MTJ87701.1 amino acid permease [Nocardia seriolae]MTK31694.1 amino acid permease [Nocardia seriolae]MTK42167.1 amino acid permease [Nocardia seriolae]